MVCQIWCKRGPSGGVETPITPDEPDVLDAGDTGGRAWGRWSGDGFVECVECFQKELSPKTMLLCICGYGSISIIFDFLFFGPTRGGLEYIVSGKVG